MNFWPFEDWRLCIRSNGAERWQTPRLPFALIGSHPDCQVQLEGEGIPDFAYLVCSFTDGLEIWPLDRSVTVVSPVVALGQQYQIGSHCLWFDHEGLEIPSPRANLARQTRADQVSRHAALIPNFSSEPSAALDALDAALGADYRPKPDDFLAAATITAAPPVSKPPAWPSAPKHAAPTEVSEEEYARILLEWNNKPRIKPLHRRVTIIGNDHPSTLRLRRGGLMQCDHAVVAVDRKAWLINLCPSPGMTGDQLVKPLPEGLQDTYVGSVRIGLNPSSEEQLWYAANSKLYLRKSAPASATSRLQQTAKELDQSVTRSEPISEPSPDGPSDVVPTQESCTPKQAVSEVAPFEQIPVHEEKFQTPNEQPITPSTPVPASAPVSANTESKAKVLDPMLDVGPTSDQATSTEANTPDTNEHSKLDDIQSPPSITESVQLVNEALELVDEAQEDEFDAPSVTSHTPGKPLEPVVATTCDVTESPNQITTAGEPDELSESTLVAMDLPAETSTTICVPDSVDAPLHGPILDSTDETVPPVDSPKTELLKAERRASDSMPDVSNSVLTINGTSGNESEEPSATGTSNTTSSDVSTRSDETPSTPAERAAMHRFALTTHGMGPMNQAGRDNADAAEHLVSQVTSRLVSIDHVKHGRRRVSQRAICAVAFCMAAGLLTTMVVQKVLPYIHFSSSAQTIPYGELDTSIPVGVDTLAVARPD